MRRRACADGGDAEGGVPRGQDVRRPLHVRQAPRAQQPAPTASPSAWAAAANHRGGWPAGGHPGRGPRSRVANGGDCVPSRAPCRSERTIQRFEGGGDEHDVAVAAHRRIRRHASRPVSCPTADAFRGHLPGGPSRHLWVPGRSPRRRFHLSRRPRPNPPVPHQVHRGASLVCGGRERIRKRRGRKRWRSGRVPRDPDPAPTVARGGPTPR